MDQGLRLSKVSVRLEIAVALWAGILGILTIFWHDWIEALTGWDPDQHSGSVEWVVVVTLLAVAVAMGLVARRHWKLLTAIPDK
jgi:hypothetical protein